MRRIWWLTWMALMTLSITPRKVYANGFSCEGTAGAVIFTDTLYGAGVAAVLSGLYVWSQNDDKSFNAEKALASGTLGGASLGVALGIVEVAMRDCSEPRRKSTQVDESGVRFSLYALQARDGRVGTGPGLAWRF